MQRLQESRARSGMKRATIKRVDTEAIRIKGPQRDKNLTIKRADAEAKRIRGPQRDEKGGNKEMAQRLYEPRARRAIKRPTIKRADAEAIRIKGPQKDEKGDNKESGCIGYTNQEPAEG